jgi:heme oxygenase (mycobilin-producing)
MIIRIVKLTFSLHETERFLELFKERQQRIAGFEGCLGVELLRDIKHPEVFFTYSRWQSPEHLENYRHSSLFKETWALVKPHFTAKPEAWSVRSQM